MSDEKNPIPPGDPRRTTGRYGPSVEKPTVETPAIPGPLAAVLAEIQESVREGFVRINANVDATHEAVDGLRDRVGRLEEMAAKSRTGPQKTFSGEVRRVSENDMKQDADIGLAKGDIAAIREEVKEIKNEVTGLKDTQARQTNNISAIKETNLEVKAAVTGFFRQHPELTGGLATLLGVIITLLTAWFQARVHQ